MASENWDKIWTPWLYSSKVHSKTPIPIFQKKLAFKFSFHFRTENKCHCLKQGFLSSALLTFGATSFLTVGDYLVHCRMVSSISDMYPLNASRTSPGCDKNVSNYCQMSPCGENHPQLRNSDPELEPSGQHWVGRRY